MFIIQLSLLVKRLNELRPTQISVGFKEVGEKGKELADRGAMGITETPFGRGSDLSPFVRKRTVHTRCDA